VLAPLASVHPLMVTVPVVVPATLVQVVLPLGPLAAEAAPLVSASDNPDAETASAAPTNKIRRI
jgi:hypothetical protein